MASNAEYRVVNLAGLVQGITLVTFPAASTILTDPTEYDLTAIATSLLGSRLASRFSAKDVLLAGLASNIASMLLLVVTTAFESDQAVAYPLLLLATAFLGTGFGLTVPVVNTYVAAFRPDHADRAVLVLNAHDRSPRREKSPHDNPSSATRAAWVSALSVSTVGSRRRVMPSTAPAFMQASIMRSSSAGVCRSDSPVMRPSCATMPYAPQFDTPATMR